MDKRKEKIREACLSHCSDLIQRTRKEFDFATEASNSESKSSAGDKHETGRAMAQIEQEKAAKQLNEALELQSFLLNVNSEISTTSVRIGNLVITNKGNFYISIPAGKLIIDDLVYFAISPQSPMGKALMGRKKRETISILDKKYIIEEII